MFFIDIFEKFVYTIKKRTGDTMFYLFLLLLFIIYEWKIKNYIDGVYDFGKETLILKEKIRIRKYHNYGAFLNIMEKKKKLLHGISLIFTLVISLVFFFTLFHKGNHILKFGLTLLLGGAFSNTYDRLSRNYVVDYFSFCSPFPKLNRIVFNLSDFCILIGTLIVVLKTS